jgi:hypothetical protein
MFDEEVFDVKVYDEMIIRYEIKEKLSYFTDKIKEKYGFNWDICDIEYEINTESFVKINSDRVGDCLTQNAFRILDKEEREYFEYLEIVSNYVGVSAFGFPLSSVSNTEFYDVILHISIECPDEVAEEIEDKIRDLFYGFMWDLTELLYNLKEVVDGGLKK